MQALPARAAYAVFTLYMMLLLFRWASVYLQIDLYNPRLRWIKTATDPLINLVKRYVPALGPFDFSVFIAMVAVYVLRQITVGILVNLFV
jgi:YggT family protein